MRDLVLVDSQPARIRLFREAMAVYRERLRALRTRSTEARVKAAELVARARRAAEVMSGFAIMRRESEQFARRPAEEVRLHVFPCRQEAIKFLRREPPYEWAPRPSVLFTDLFVEDDGGVSLIRQLKADPSHRDVPAVMLCSGATPGEIRDAWDAGSNGVVDLPGEVPERLVRVADALEFWLVEAAG